MRAIVPACLAMMSFVAQAADWKNYLNGRFGFSVDVPASFKSKPPPLNGDGLGFVSKDKTAEISIYGHNITFHHMSSKSLADDAREYEELASDLRITYRQIAPSAYTLSGVSGDRIVYIHAVKTCKGEAAAILRVEYPQADKLQFDPLIAHMAGTLHGSNACWY